MTFEQYLDQAWTDHATDALKVSKSFSQGVALLQTEDDVLSLAHLMTHVFGEHLGQWDSGKAMLKELQTHRITQSSEIATKSLSRYQEVLKVASGHEINAKDFSVSDQIRIFALAAGAAMAHVGTEVARDYFFNALELAQRGIEKSDPANRTLAATGNNIACTLEEKEIRSEEETKLMILAAETARRYWEIAGGPSEVSLAEYRLAHTFIKAKDLKRALEHALLAVEVATENVLPPLYHFSAYEALVQTEKLSANSRGFETATRLLRESFAKLSEEEKQQNQDRLRELTGD